MPSSDLSAGQHVAGFIVDRVAEIPELRSRATLFAHEKTGAQALHLSNDDPNNLFCIAFRTPIHDNTGVPHILEHSVLCGSRKFRVKDPFQELLKGSLQTFLNALTYPDKTMYPVSSQVETDFYNLVDVYCDAVFHPLLSENTFLQEGWHFDVADPAGPIDIKGIVYNEMKGVFSDFRSHVARTAMNALFPDTTYAWESGGEPQSIPGLIWQGLRDFHAQFYHPSNSRIFLYGNLPPEKTLAFLDERYLREYGRRAVDSAVRPQDLWSAPRRLSIQAPAPAGEDGTATVAVAWIVGESADPLVWLTGSVLSRCLLGAESSPLKRALIDSGLGEDLDDISGFDAGLVQATFAAGLRKTKPEHAAKIETTIFDTLRACARDGFEPDLLEGALRQTEFKLREIANSSFPYNLNLADRCYRSWLYDGDPLAYLAFEKPLAAVKAGGMEHFTRALRAMMIDNTHYLTITVRASSAMGKKIETLTQEQVARLTAGATDEQRRAWVATTRQLTDEQKRPSDPAALAALPRLSKSDLPPRNQRVPAERGRIGAADAFLHPLFTSGIVYLDIGFDFSAVPPDLVPWLPLYGELITRCGAAGISYQEMANRVALAMGGLTHSVVADTMTGARDRLCTRFFLHGKALPERFDDMAGIFNDLLHAPDLSNVKQLRDIILEMKNDLNASIVHDGHVVAVTHASAQLCSSSALDEQMGGIAQLRFLHALVEKDDMSVAISAMRRLHEIIARDDACVVSMTADDPGRYQMSVEKLIGSLTSRPDFHPGRPPAPIVVPVPSGIEIASSVNFVAQAWKLAPHDAQTAGLLYLLARNLYTGYLWDKVRVEGGAYGGRAFYSTAHPVFACASYRDPNLSRTLDHFKQGLAATARGLESGVVDQSIIGAIGKVDAPQTPHGKGFSETVALLAGSTVEFRQAIRDSILRATPDALARIAQRILEAQPSAITVIGSAAAFDAAQAEGLAFKREKLLA
jgi:hypothetical protein